MYPIPLDPGFAMVVAFALYVVSLVGLFLGHEIDDNAFAD